MVKLTGYAGEILDLESGNDAQVSIGIALVIPIQRIEDDDHTHP